MIVIRAVRLVVAPSFLDPVTTLRASLLASLVLAATPAVAQTFPTPPSIAVSQKHACAVDARGRALCWGNNVDGQVGDGTIGASVKVDVAGVSGATAIAAGTGVACAIVGGGRVRCWGDNTFGQLGDGTAQPRQGSVEVANVAGATALHAGRFSCALVNGAARCWGATSNITGTVSPTPADLPGLSSGVTSIAGSSSHGCAVVGGGVRCYGINDAGQLGNGASGPIQNAPAPVQGLASGVQSVVVGNTHSCALTTGGGVLCWGSNRFGQLGDGTFADRLVPVPVSGLSSGVVALAAGGAHTCARMATGTVKCWGSNQFGETQPATFDITSLPTPVDIAGLSGVTKLSAGTFHTCAITSGGAFQCWGRNLNGELGDGTTVTGGLRNVAGVTGAREVAAGDAFTCAVNAAGAAQCWGYNDAGQLGGSGTNPYNVPVQVVGLASGVRAVDVGFFHSCAVLTSGVVRCWGGNASRQRGDSDTTARGTPADVAGLPPMSQVSVSDSTSCALAVAGSVWCWGSVVQAALIAQVNGLAATNTAIAVGQSFGCAVDTGGGMRCWGSNDFGQLGNGTTASSATAVAVTGLQGGMTGVAAGLWHACGLRNDGIVLCWGQDVVGQLGDGNTVNRTVPAVVPGLTDVVAITAKAASTCALKSSGAVWCWGNQFGSRPAPVPELQSGVGRVASNGFLTCVIVAGGGVACQGDNDAGQLGDGTLVARRDRPSAVVSPDRRNFLDLTPDDPLAADKQPPFLALATAAGSNISATLFPRAQDVGTTASTFVFALAPATNVLALKNGEAPLAIGKAVRGDGSKADVACVLAQLTANGQLVGVSAASLQAYVTGVLTAQGQAVTIVDGQAVANIGGATFYLGYGASGAQMLTGGNNRSVATVPGAVTCRPAPPETGWWWNANEGGRGYSIEVQGNHIFYASFLYDDAGRSTWYVATGSTSLDGSLFTGDLLRVAGGQSLGGAYRAPGPAQSVGPFTLAFSDATRGTMIWPGGTVAIERFNIVPGGLAAPPDDREPESGWWWNPQESGRGFFIEYQAGTADLAGYMYDESGNAIWYLTVVATPNLRALSSSWWLYANGQSLTGAYRPATRTNDNVAPVSMTFTSATTATMTLPNGRTTNLVRHRF